MGAEPTNGDGFGIGWYSAAGGPGIFKSMEPAWNDRNLRELAGHVESHLFVAHVRATTGTPVQQTNCHPFRYGKWLWVHNGRDVDWLTVKRDLVLAVDPALYPLIEGTTDSEVLFYPRADAWPRGGSARRRRARDRPRRGGRSTSTASSTRSRARS